MKFAFVGTHNSGKSTTVWHIASELKKKGFNKFNVVPEVARFCPYKLSGDFISQLWMLNKQMQLETHANLFHDFVLCDRSVYDMVAYARASPNTTSIEIEILRVIADVWGKYKPYTAIFYLEPLNLVDDGVRTLDPELQKRVDKELKDVLLKLLPKATLFYVFDGTKEKRCKTAFKYVWEMINNEPKRVST